jgi:hypothetical protein
MSTDLTELKERLDFVGGDIQNLRAQIFKFTVVSAEVNIEHNGSGAFQIYARLTKQIPTALGSRAGMIANELRSILDSLACQLAIRNGKSTSHVYFPVSKSAAIFAIDGMRKISKLAEADQNAIIALNPFKEGNPILFGLHEADRTRKHQRLVASAAQGNLDVGGMGAIFGGANVSMVGCTVNGAPVGLLNFGPTQLEVGVWKPVGFGIAVDAQIDPIVSIAYQEPEEIAGNSVPEMLTYFQDIVREIIAKFG